VPLLFSIQDETLSAFNDVNMAAAAAANETVNTTDPNFAVRAAARAAHTLPNPALLFTPVLHFAGVRKLHLGPLSWVRGNGPVPGRRPCWG